MYCLFETVSCCEPALRQASCVLYTVLGTLCLVPCDITATVHVKVSKQSCLPFAGALRGQYSSYRTQIQMRTILRAVLCSLQAPALYLVFS